MRRSDHELVVRELRKLIDAQAAQIRELQDRLMYANGTPWTPPPLDPVEEREEDEEHEDPLFPGYTSDSVLTGV